MRIVSLISFLLMIVGALNWLTVGISRFDLVRRLFGRNTLIGRLVYGLVGLSGLLQLATFTLRTVRGKPYPASA